MWNQDTDVQLAVKALRACIASLSPGSQEALRQIARMRARSLILGRHIQAANLLRVMTGVVDS